MALPSVKINFDNGTLGTVIPMADGTAGLMASAVAVGTTFLLNTSYKIKGMRDVAKLGIDPAVAGNARLYKTLQEFYAQAGEGAVLWLMGRARTELVSNWFKIIPATGLTPADDLLNSAQGEIRILFTSYSPTTPIDLDDDVTNGLHSDVWEAMPLANDLATRFTSEKYAPFIVLLEGYGFDGDTQDLSDLKSIANSERVAVMIGDTLPRGTGATANYGCAVGILAGKLAQNQVHVNIGKVRDGSVNASKLYVLDTPSENFDFEELNDKSYITFRYHQGKSGYYFIDDPMATEQTNDYYRITNRRVIDKAYRIAYDTLVNYLLDNVPVKSGGNIAPSYIKAMQTEVETKIASQMTAKGELSTDSEDKNDLGVKCFIDPNQNIVATSQLNVDIRVRPYGYNRWIVVQLGFTV